MLKILYILVTCLIVTSCEHTMKSIARPHGFDYDSIEGPYEYVEGWKDGCDTAFSSANTNLHQSIGTYQYTMDSDLWQRSPLYKRVWNDAFYFCSYMQFTNFMLRH